MTIKAAVLGTVPVPLLPLVRRIQESPLGYRLAKGTFWSFAGTVISRGLALISWILIARLLGKTVFGEFGMIQSTVIVFGTFAGLGLGLTATRYVAEFRSKDPKKAGRIIAFSSLTASATGIIACAVLLMLAPLLASKALAAPHLADLLRVSALVVFFSTLNGAQTGALSGLEAFKSIAAINLSAGLISCPVVLAGAYFGGLRGTVWALAATMILNWLLNHWALRREVAKANIPVVFAECWRERSVLWTFSVPVVLAGILYAPITWLCSVMLANQANGYAELGLYNAAVQWQTALGFLPALLSQVMLPILSDSHSNQAEHQSRKTLSTALTVFMAVIILPAIALIGLSPWITSAYGGGFQMPVRLFNMVVIYATLANIGTALWTCLLSRNRAWFGFIGNLTWGACVLVALHYLLPKGALGLAVANVVSYIAAMAVIFPPVLKSLLARKDA